MKTKGIIASRLTRYLYEARMAFLFAILSAMVVLAAFGFRARAEFHCATDSIATGSDRCAGAVSAQDDAAEQTIRLVFQTTP